MRCIKYPALLCAVSLFLGSPTFHPSEAYSMEISHWYATYMHTLSPIEVVRAYMRSNEMKLHFVDDGIRFIVYFVAKQSQIKAVRSNRSVEGFDNQQYYCNIAML